MTHQEFIFTEQKQNFVLTVTFTDSHNPTRKMSKKVKEDAEWLDNEGSSAAGKGALMLADDVTRG